MTLNFINAILYSTQLNVLYSNTEVFMNIQKNLGIGDYQAKQVSQKANPKQKLALPKELSKDTVSFSKPQVAFKAGCGAMIGFTCVATGIACVSK